MVFNTVPLFCLAQHTHTHTQNIFISFSRFVYNFFPIFTAEVRARTSRTLFAVLLITITPMLQCLLMFNIIAFWVLDSFPLTFVRGNEMHFGYGIFGTVNSVFILLHCQGAIQWKNEQFSVLFARQRFSFDSILMPYSYSLTLSL